MNIENNTRLLLETARAIGWNTEGLGDTEIPERYVFANQLTDASEAYKSAFYRLIHPVLKDVCFSLLQRSLFEYEERTEKGILYPLFPESIEMSEADGIYRLTVKASQGNVEIPSMKEETGISRFDVLWTQNVYFGHWGDEDFEFSRYTDYPRYTVRECGKDGAWEFPTFEWKPELDTKEQPPYNKTLAVMLRELSSFASDAIRSLASIIHQEESHGSISHALVMDRFLQNWNFNKGLSLRLKKCPDRPPVSDLPPHGVMKWGGPEFFDKVAMAHSMCETSVVFHDETYRVEANTTKPPTAYEKKVIEIERDKKEKEMEEEKKEQANPDKTAGRPASPKRAPKHELFPNLNDCKLEGHDNVQQNFPAFMEYVCDTLAERFKSINKDGLRFEIQHNAYSEQPSSFSIVVHLNYEEADEGDALFSLGCTYDFTCNNPGMGCVAVRTLPMGDGYLPMVFEKGWIADCPSALLYRAFLAHEILREAVSFINTGSAFKPYAVERVYTQKERVVVFADNKAMAQECAANPALVAQTIPDSKEILVSSCCNFAVEPIGK